MGQLAERAASHALVSRGESFGLSEQMRYAQVIASGSIVPAAYRNKPADILVAIGLGQSMGLSPAESLYRINVIQGKPTASAELIAAQVRKAGHRLRIRKDEQRVSVTATIIRADDPEAPFSVTRDQQWAQQMGLASKDNYRKQPLTMLTWRAITAVAREACPEALYGVAYTPDEMTLDVATVPIEETPQKPGPVEPQPSGPDHSVKVTEMVAAFKQAGYATWEAARPEVEEILGREVPNINELTEAEINTVIDGLNTVALGKENTDE